METLGSDEDPLVNPHTKLLTYSVLFQNQQLELAVEVTIQDLLHFETGHATCLLLD